MRLPAGLCLVAASAALAAPQPKEELPPGAAGRLGTPVTPAKDGPRVGEVHALAFLDGKTLFVGTAGGWQTWDLGKRQAKQARPVGGPALAVARGPDQLFVGSARKVHALEPLQSASAEPARSWDSATDAVSVLAADPAGQRAVFSDGDQKLTLLDAKTGKAVGPIELSSRPVAASLTANGRILAVVTRDGAARTYRLSAAGALELMWTKRVARADRVAAGFSPDGRLLAVSSAGRVVLLDSVTGRQMAGLERRFGEGDVRCLAFSPDSRHLAVGSNGPEAVVRVWAVATAADQGTFTGHRGDVNALAFSPDGKTLASGGEDQAVLLWTVPPAPADPKPVSMADAWKSLDALDGAEAYRVVGSLLADPKGAVAGIGAGARGLDKEQAQLRRWLAELDHDEFRVREAARRELLKAGLRGAAVLNDPGRKRLGAEGEQRVRQILEAFDSQGLRVPEGGLFGEPLRAVRAVRVLESIGGKEARAVLEEMARGPAESLVVREAKAALEAWPR